MKKRRVMILESDAEFARELQDYFAHTEEFEVVGVTDDGAAGISRMREIRTDAVVMSLSLKDTDGFSVLEQARKMQDPPAFVVTGDCADDGFVRSALASGAKYYLLKPVSAAVVTEYLRELAEESEENSVGRSRGKNRVRTGRFFVDAPHIKRYAFPEGVWRTYASEKDLPGGK